jgi:4-hydroxy-tetrahydrodipicolinate synthase
MSKQKQTLFRGAATALITPFREGRIDFEAFGALIDRQIEQGIDALVVVGTTGESATLTHKEKIALIAYAAARVDGRVPLIAGSGCADTAGSILLSREAASAGADALLVVTPYYNRPSQEGLYAHFCALADCVRLPMLLYHIPGRTGVTLSLSTYDRLAEHPNIVGVKDAGADVAATARLIRKCGDRLDVYAGNDDLTLPVLSVGGMGVISVLSNLMPRAVHDICRLWREGKPRLAGGKAAALGELTEALFADSNPGPVKTALELLSLCRAEVRLPLTEPDAALRARLEQLLRERHLLE